MRLLNTRTRKFKCFEHPEDVTYAILSHVWVKSNDGIPLEQSFDAVRHIQAAYPDGPVPLPDEGLFSPKITKLCRIALADGYDYVWIDSACIDNSSSAELSEAINSMYHWYSRATVCYAYLADVSYRTATDERKLTQQFAESCWFKRGWTLQELIAPRIVIFLTAEWEVIDTKQNLAGRIHVLTGIDTSILTHPELLSSISVAKRMSWAYKRETTKIEDQAYCLMGIFGVHMPIVYGEGSRAFFRLQEEIYRHTADDSILAWGRVFEDRAPFTEFLKPSSSPQDGEGHLADATSGSVKSHKQYLFAPTPKAFKYSADLEPISYTELAHRLGLRAEGASYAVRMATPFGLQTRLPLAMVRPFKGGTPLFLAFLACQSSDDALVALLLHPARNPVVQSMDKQFVIGHEVTSRTIDADDFNSGTITAISFSDYLRTVKVTSQEVKDAKTKPRYVTIYIVAHPPSNIDDMHRDRKARQYLYMPTRPVVLSVASWCLSLLDTHGFHVVGNHSDSPAGLVKGPDILVIPLHLTIYHGADIVAGVSVHRCGCRFGQENGYLAVTVEVSKPQPPSPICWAPSVDHTPDNPEHVFSWAHHAGSSSKEFVLSRTKAQPDSEVNRKMRLCLSRSVVEHDARTEQAPLILSIEIDGSDLNGVVDQREVEGADDTAAEGGLADDGSWLRTLAQVLNVVKPWFTH